MSTTQENAFLQITKKFEELNDVRAADAEEWIGQVAHTINDVGNNSIIGKALNEPTNSEEVAEQRMMNAREVNLTFYLATTILPEEDAAKLVQTLCHTPVFLQSFALTQDDEQSLNRSHVLYGLTEIFGKVRTEDKQNAYEELENAGCLDKAFSEDGGALSLFIKSYAKDRDPEEVREALRNSPAWNNRPDIPNFDEFAQVYQIEAFIPD
ncbi:MAG: hypothetical protein ACRBCK_02875 [Alphaproteobacteria bacterium]